MAKSDKMNLTKGDQGSPFNFDLLINDNWDKIDSEFTDRGVNVEWFHEPALYGTNHTVAFTLAQKTGRTVFVPDKTYNVTTDIDLSKFYGYGRVLKNGIAQPISNPLTQNTDVALMAKQLVMLDTKINSQGSGSPKGVYPTVAALRAAIPSGNNNTYVVSEDGKWYYWNGTAWTPGSVYQATALEPINLSKTTFSTIGKNLFDKTRALLNFSVNLTNGEPATDTSCYMSDFIPVQPDISYVKNAPHSFGYYNANKVFIGGVAAGAVVTPPSACRYVRLSVAKTMIDTLQFEVGTVPSDYVPYKEYIPNTFLERTKPAVEDIPPLPMEKLAFAVTSKNLFDKEKSIAGYYVNQENGSLGASTDYVTSDYIPVKPLTNYAKNNDNRVAFFDEGKRFISGILNPAAFTFITPPNTAFLRVSIKPAETDINTFQLEEGTIRTSFTPYRPYIKIDSLENGILTDTRFSSLLALKTGKNLFNPEKAVPNYYLNHLTGDPNPDTVFYVSDFIEVTPSTTYIKSTTHTFAYYDADKKFISGVQSAALLTTPPTCKYVRVSVLRSVIQTFQLEKGTVLSAFEPYETRIPNTRVEKPNLTAADVPSLPMEKLAFVSQSRNLFNAATSTPGVFVNQATGALDPNVGYTTSDFILVKPQTDYAKNSDNRIAFYDSNKLFISGIASTPGYTFRTPTNTAYVRASFQPAITPLDTFQLEEGTYRTPYVPFKQYIKLDLLEPALLTEGKLAEMFDIQPGKNLFNPAKATLGYYVNWTNGRLDASAAYGASDLIEVTPGQAYTRNLFPLHYAWYTEKFAFISGDTQSAAGKTLTAPENAKYIRFSIRPAELQTTMFEKGTISTAFEPYGFKFNRLLVPEPKSTDINTIMNLPSRIPALVGKEINVYFDNLMNNAKWHDIDLACPEGEQRTKKYMHTFTEPKSVSFAVNKFKDGILQKNKSVTIVAKDISEVTKNFKVLVIGDSTTAGAGKSTKRLLDLFATDTYSTLKLLGTRGTAPDRHEGRSGWTINQYVSVAADSTDPTVTNPFWNPTTKAFDFAYYMEQTAQEVPTHIVLNLGINDMFGFGDDQALSNAIDTFIANYDKVIANIKAYNNDIMICIALTIPPNANQDVFGMVYKCGQTQWRYKRNNEFFVNRLIEKYDNRSAEGIQLIPLNTVLDMETDFADGVHPSVAGYQKIGDAYYRFLKVLG